MPVISRVNYMIILAICITVLSHRFIFSTESSQHKDVEVKSKSKTEPPPAMDEPSWHDENEELFPYGSTGLKLPKRLSEGLDSFLAGNQCSRWETPEDGEDLVRLLLEVTFFGIDQNITQENMVKEVFKVG